MVKTNDRLARTVPFAPPVPDPAPRAKIACKAAYD